MKYCNKCGQQLSDDATFCSKCGARINTNNSTGPQRSNDSPSLIIPLLLAVTIALIIIMGAFMF